MPKLSDKKVEELLIAYLEKSKGMPLEELLRRAIGYKNLDALQGQQVLEDMRSRGVVESSKGWWRLLSQDESEERKSKGIKGLFRKK